MPRSVMSSADASDGGGGSHQRPHRRQRSNEKDESEPNERNRGKTNHHCRNKNNDNSNDRSSTDDSNVADDCYESGSGEDEGRRDGANGRYSHLFTTDYIRHDLQGPPVRQMIPSEECTSPWMGEERFLSHVVPSNASRQHAMHRERAVGNPWRKFGMERSLAKVGALSASHCRDVLNSREPDMDQQSVHHDRHHPNIIALIAEEVPQGSAEQQSHWIASTLHTWCMQIRLGEKGTKLTAPNLREYLKGCRK